MPVSSGRKTLRYGESPVRIVMIDGVPWFSLEDLCLTRDLHPVASKTLEDPAFPTHAMRICLEETEEGLAETVILSPTGVWWLSQLAAPHASRKLAAWARREAQCLFPNAEPGDERMYLTLNEDGSLPPRPNRYTGRLPEFEVLKLAPEHIAYLRLSRPSVVNMVRTARSQAAADRAQPQTLTA